MSSVASSTVPFLPAGPAPETALAEAARGPARASTVAAVLSRGAADGAAPAWMGADGALAAASGWIASALAGAPGAAGYARLVSGAGSTAAAASKGTGAAVKATASTAPRITGEWAFLTSPSLSIEEKLARFMLAVQKKMDDDLTRKMEEYRAKYGEGGSESKKEDGGGIFGAILKILCPPLAIADSIFGGVDEFLAQGLKTLGGPLLAALATALGMPGLAPAALQIGKGIGEAVVASRPKPASTAKSKDSAPAAGKTGSSTSSSKTGDAKSSSGKTTGKDSTSKTTAKGEAGSPDERLEMLEIQRLVEKQNALFTLVSNVMKNMHETTMTAVQNVR